MRVATTITARPLVGAHPAACRSHAKARGRVHCDEARLSPARQGCATSCALSRPPRGIRARAGDAQACGASRRDEMEVLAIGDPVNLPGKLLVGGQHSAKRIKHIDPGILAGPPLADGAGHLKDTGQDPAFLIGLFEGDSEVHGSFHEAILSNFPVHPHKSSLPTSPSGQWSTSYLTRRPTATPCRGRAPVRYVHYRN